MGREPQQTIKQSQCAENNSLNHYGDKSRHFINLTLVLTPSYGILTTSTNNLGREK